MDGPGHRVGLVLGLVVLLACGVFVGLRFRVTTAITHFLAAPEELVLARISRALADSELTRTMVLTVSGPEPQAAARAAAALEERLRDHPEVAWITTGPEPDLGEALYELYFPRRFLFASDRPELELPQRLSDAELRRSAAALKRALSSPMAPLVKRAAPDDPLLLFRHRMRTLEEARAGPLELEGGRFVTADGQHSVVFLATRHSPFDSVHQRPLEHALDQAIREIAAPGVVVERSSVHRFALASERAIRSDIQRITVISLIGIVALFAGFFRSLRLLLVALVPLGAGVLCATAVGLAIFGELHGLTLAFGSTLIGVCIDYPVHYFTHHTVAPDPRGPWATLRRVWPGIALGGLTTLAGFAGLVGASFPGIREIGVFACVGVAAALLATRTMLPALVGPTRAPRHQRLVARLGDALERLGSRRQRLLLVPAAALMLAAVGLPQLRWIDDATALNRLQPAMMDEDTRVRERVARVETGRLIVAVGATEEQALQRNDAVFERTRELAERDQVELHSLHRFLWSEQLQRRSLGQMQSDSGLAERIRGALAAEGFRPQAFAGLEQAIAEVPAPLRPADLADSPLARAVRSFWLDLGDQVAIVTFCRSLDDADQVEDAVAGLEGVHYFDQQRFLAATYRRYRERLIPLLVLGLVAVAAIVLVRYRSPGLAIAAFVPALLAALGTVGVLALFGVQTHLLHLVALLLVLSIGVDYGVFLAESTRHPGTAGATVLSLVIACGSTVLAFGLLAMSQNPALRAVGLTTGIGVFASLLLAPTTWLVLKRGPR